MSNETSDSVSRTVVTLADSSEGRSLEQTGPVLSEWLAKQIADASAVEIVSLGRPTTNGGSSENYFITADIRSGGETRREKYVLRVKPGESCMFLRENFDEQCRLITHLGAHTDVPVPEIEFYEPDAAVLGQPFWLMAMVEGEVPPDNPPYHTAGYVFDALPEQRRSIWLSGLEAACRIPKVDVSQMPQIVELRPGESGMEENLRHWTDAMHWACDGVDDPLLQRVNEWLWANMPSRRDTALSWGDCRIGNMIFQNFQCAAIIDWDTITLAGPQLDLAHWLVMEEYFIDGFGFEPLPGIGTRDEVIEKWEKFTGFAADQLGWHEVLAMFRLDINCVRGFKFLPPDMRAKQFFDDGSTVMSRVLESVFARETGQ
ncbi:MAG: phosphotransferase family protein [Novosphingobium sp.]|nr:phosphotransferase family protein [Novosphingobium sp.]